MRGELYDNSELMELAVLLHSTGISDAGVESIVEAVAELPEAKRAMYLADLAQALDGGFRSLAAMAEVACE